MDLKELKPLLKLLREKGVLEFEISGLRLKLSEEDPETKKRLAETNSEMEGEPELTEEELLFYSATPPLQQTETQ